MSNAKTKALNKMAQGTVKGKNPDMTKVRKVGDKLSPLQQNPRIRVVEQK